MQMFYLNQCPKKTYEILEEYFLVVIFSLLILLHVLTLIDLKEVALYYPYA